MGDVRRKTEVAIKYLHAGEKIAVNSIGQNIISDQLERDLDIVRKMLPGDYRAHLHPNPQRTEDYRRLIVSRS